MTASPQTDPPAFQSALSRWFRENARDLPWRRTADPYAIVVSEFMLQQTQVKTVLPYYARWLAAFPTFGDLASAPEERVLSLWQGLGYYSRARALHRLAQAVAALPEFPRAPAEIRCLPGIGPYTAGAIAAFAFDQPAPAVDGNIARVVARLFLVRDPIDSTAGLARIWELAESLLPAGPGGGREQVGAIMELGAVVCLARRPLCLLCPVREFCAGRSDLGGAVDELPVKKARPRQEERAQYAVWSTDPDDRILLQRSAGPLWKDMWHLPLVATPTGEPLAELTFGITRYKVRLRAQAAGAGDVYIPFRLKDSATEPSQVETRWFPEADLAHLPMPAPHRKILGRLTVPSAQGL